MSRWTLLVRAIKKAQRRVIERRRRGEKKREEKRKRGTGFNGGASARFRFQVAAACTVGNRV